MKKAPLLTGLLACTLALQACSDASSVSPLLAALEENQAEAESSDRVFIDYNELYPDQDKFIIVCQGAFREMALEHAGLADDAIEPLSETEGAVVAYSSGDSDNVFADVIDLSDVTLCEGVQKSAIPITQNMQPFAYSEEFTSETGAPWRRTGGEEALY